MPIENFDEVKSYFETNKDNEDVKGFVNSFKVEPTLEVFKEKFNKDKDFKEQFSNDKDFKAFLDSEKDKHANKSLETWKSNNLQKLIDEEVKKRYPEADPKDKALAELKLQLDQMQKDTTRKDLTNKALKIAQEKKLPTELVDYLIGEDEETTNKNIEKLVEIFAKRDEVIKTEFVKGGGYIPPKDTKPPTSEDLAAKAKAQMEKIMGIKF